MPKLMARRRRSQKAAGQSPVADDMSDQPERDFGEFGEIARRHKPYLHQVARRLSGDKDVANDLVQETLVRALFTFNRFKQGTNARVWLTTILTHYYLDTLKHEKVVHKAGEQLVTLEVVGCEIDRTPPEISEAALAVAVDALEADLRNVVVCFHLQGLSYKEAADKLGVPIGTISTRLKRARERLKALLSEEH